jgi:hypothetical protein
VDSRPGEVVSRQSEVDSRPGEVDSRPGEIDSRPGDLDGRLIQGVDSRPGEVVSRQSEVDSRPGEVDSRTGEIDSRPVDLDGRLIQGVDSRPGEVVSRPCEIDSRPGTSGTTASAVNRVVSALIRDAELDESTPSSVNQQHGSSVHNSPRDVSRMFQEASSRNPNLIKQEVRLRVPPVPAAPLPPAIPIPPTVMFSAPTPSTASRKKLKEKGPSLSPPKLDIVSRR